jgi:hypothetical protein
VTAKTRAIVELGVAVVAALGTVWCWLAARSAVVTAPVLPTEPSKISMAYSPSLIALAFLLATVAGVFAVIGIARLRR